MHTTLRRSVVALATTLACLAVLATPASATTHNVTITGGTLFAINATGTSTSTTDLSATPGAGCTSTIVADVVPDGTGNAGTVNVTGFSNIGHFTLGTNHYVSTMSRVSSSAGTWGTSATGTISSLSVQVSTQIRAAATNNSTNVDCATTGTVLCTLRMTLHLAGTYANGPLSTTGATFNLSTTTSAAITLGIGTCQVPFSTFNGGTVTITNMTGVAT